MKKIPELVRLAASVFFFCTAGVLLSGCSVQTAMSMKGYELNPKIWEVNPSWINKFAKPEQTKDVDILHKLCKPTYIQQYSNGEKAYTYMAFTGDKWKYNSVTFLFDKNRALKKTFFKSSPISPVYFSPFESTVSDEDFLPFLETLPSNPTRQLLKKKLGVPMMLEDEGNIMTYSYPNVSFVSFYIKSDGKVEYMIIPKTFWDFARKNHARFNIKTIYGSERKINEAESAAIERCEK